MALSAARARLPRRAAATAVFDSADMSGLTDGPAVCHAMVRCTADAVRTDAAPGLQSRPLGFGRAGRSAGPPTRAASRDTLTRARRRGAVRYHVMIYNRAWQPRSSGSRTSLQPVHGGDDANLQECVHRP